jgi:hypothetical protein
VTSRGDRQEAIFDDDQDRRALLKAVSISTPRSDHGGGHINVVQGGLQVLNEKGDDGWLIANAIIAVSMDDGK